MTRRRAAPSALLVAAALCLAAGGWPAAPAPAAGTAPADSERPVPRPDPTAVAKAGAGSTAAARPAGPPEAAVQARAAAAGLKQAIAALGTASGAQDRVAALTRTIQAYEAGLTALRTGLRRVTFREEELEKQFNARSNRLSQLLGVLATMQRTPPPLMLVGPGSPVDTVRAGMIASDVTPALRKEVAGLQGQLQEMAQLRASQEAAADVLRQGMRKVQAARTDLSQAISNRTDLPKRFTEAPAELAQVAQSVDSLGKFADLLSDRRMAEADPTRAFTSAEGSLPFPVEGTILHDAGDADAAGIKRPGITIATPPRALVTAPWAATIRYVGPLLDYGNVIILEPGDGYLLVLAGLDLVYGKIGDVIAAGTPVGLMGGIDADPQEFIASTRDGAGAGGTETLYMELRQGSRTIDPDPWFARTRNRTTP